MFESFDELQVYLGDKLKLSLPRYPRFGDKNTLMFEHAIADLENGKHAITTSSGLSAIVTALTALLTSGDHVLLTVGVYGSTQNFCRDILSKFDISITYFDPHQDGDLQSKVKYNTKLIFIESPCSIGIDLIDIESIVFTAKSNNLITVMDNTWATPLLFHPLDYGVDVVIHSASKYISGDSTFVLGVIVTNEQYFEQIRMTYLKCGACAGSNEISVALTGLNTIQTRLQVHYDSALKIAKYFETFIPTERIKFPPLESSKDFGLWKKYYKGGNGLISLEFDYRYRNDLIAIVNGLNMFNLAFGWGGAESKVMIYDQVESASMQKKRKSIMLRFSIGLEPVDALMADLQDNFLRVKNNFF